MKTIYKSNEPKSIILVGSTIYQVEKELKWDYIDQVLSITDDYAGIDIKYNDGSTEYFETDGFISIIDPRDIKVLVDSLHMDSLNFIVLDEFIGEINVELISSEGEVIEEDFDELNYIQYQDLSQEWIDVVITIPKNEFKVIDFDELISEFKLLPLDE